MSKSPPLSELTGRQISWIAGGAVSTFATMPGQTNFIAQFNSALRAEFELSHGQFGVIYTAATLASATALIWAGPLVDRHSARGLAALAIAGLALTALAMAGMPNVAVLVVTIAFLRFFGQGMLSHIAMTSMSRWFNRFRGRALSFAGLGFTLGEATLPFVLTMSIVAFGWREVWGATALILVAVLAPLIWFLLRDPPDGPRARAAGRLNSDPPPSGGPTGTQWQRAAVLRDPLFWAILPGIMAPPAIGTLFIFHQAHLTALKGWDITTFTAFFPFLSFTGAATAILSGFLVDRFGAWRLMPILLLPLAMASVLAATLQPQWSIPILFASFGLSMGLLGPIIGSLWVELYGTAHIGAIRALASSALVAASALGPGLAGLLIDVGIDLDVQGFGYAAYCLAASAIYFALRSRMRERSAALAQPEAGG